MEIPGAPLFRPFLFFFLSPRYSRVISASIDDNGERAREAVYPRYRNALQRVASEVTAALLSTDGRRFLSRKSETIAAAHPSARNVYISIG